MRYSYVLIAAATVAASSPSQNWALISPTTQPSVRRSGAMAFDATQNRLILYGGVNPTPSVILSETWSYNGQWTLLSPPGGATARWGHQLVRNSVLNRLITFGGRSPTISGFANDSYAWTGSAWTTLPATNAPPPRYLYGMAYDSLRDKVVMFGGRAPLTTLGDTWELTNNGATWSWQQILVATSPPPREEMLMTYDPTIGRTLMFGGYDRDTDTILGDTWAYDGTDWVQLAPTTNPTPRYRMASAFDSFRMRSVMYGGYDGQQILQETYEFRVENWFLITTANPGSINATEMYAGYDPQPTRRKFVTFGGAGAAFSNQTHEYTSAGGGLYSQFGTPCPSTQPAGVVTCGVPLPTIGQNLNLTFAPLDLAAQLVLVVIGFAQIPPVDLGFLGLPSCELVVAPDLTQIATATAGSAPFTLAIPNQPSFINQSLYFQGLPIDLASPSLFIAVTGAGRAILGN